MCWGGLSAYLALMDRLTQASRDCIASERFQQRAQEQQRTLTEALRRQRGWSITDLDGQRRWLELTQLASFQQSCYGELELQQGCSWAELRRHWRRNSLRWHPDHGGDPNQWLRKQRAYDALRQLGGDTLASRLVRGGASRRSLLPPPRRRRWPWR
ncbi:hypothetical protein H6G65_09235 [Microcystis elabens FACHB-917]|nr:hypothetical protein [Microcystis elabens FACHB-917]